jgi:hypothetical protein
MAYKIVEADSSHAQTVMEVTNDAFMADAFFKKEEYFNRFDFQTVIDMMNSPNSKFLIMAATEDNSIVGSIFLHWEVTETENELQVCCIFINIINRLFFVFFYSNT